MSIEPEPQKPKVIKEPTKPKFSTEKLVEILESFKKPLEEENEERIKYLLQELISKFEIDAIKLFCVNLLEIENLKGALVYSDANKIENRNASLKENTLNLLSSCLISLNSSSTILSYNNSFTILKYLFGDFILVNLSLNDLSNEQASKILSRKIFLICSGLCKEFPRQFILSCVVQWLMEANSKISNKIFNEFLIKIMKECFGEQESWILFQCLQTDCANLKWTDIIYSVLSVLIEKIPNLNSENFNFLLNKMQADSASLSKSTIFSKFLQTILNKCKNHLVLNQASFESNNLKSHNETSFSQSSQSIQSNKQKVSYDSKLLNLIESIVDNNQTLIKKSLLNFVKNLKSDN